MPIRTALWRHIDVGVYWAVLLSVITLVMAFLNHHFWWHGVQLALTVRGACIGLLYLKSSSMHWSHRAEYSSGRISNLASVDGDNLMNFMWGAVHELIAAPILIVLCVAALLWVEHNLHRRKAIPMLCRLLVYARSSHSSPRRTCALERVTSVSAQQRSRSSSTSAACARTAASWQSMSSSTRPSRGGIEVVDEFRSPRSAFFINESCLNQMWGHRRSSVERSPFAFELQLQLKFHLPLH